MPRIWIKYCQFLMTQPVITKLRRTLDRALMALPVTQHSRIWDVYLQFLKKCKSIETSVRGWRRYARAFPDQTETFIDQLIQWKRYDDAVAQLVKILNDPTYESPKGHSYYQLWINLCDLVCKYPHLITCVDVEKIIRDGLHHFKDHTGRLWCALARYFIRKNMFERVLFFFFFG